jgi:hypothetical protein
MPALHRLLPHRRPLRRLLVVRAAHTEECDRLQARGSQICADQDQEGGHGHCIEGDGDDQALIPAARSFGAMHMSPLSIFLSLLFFLTNNSCSFHFLFFGFSPLFSHFAFSFRFCFSSLIIPALFSFYSSDFRPYFPTLHFSFLLFFLLFSVFILRIFALIFPFVFSFLCFSSSFHFLFF